MDGFFAAVKAGDVEAVRGALEADAGLIGARDAQGVSAVLLSVFYGKRDVTEELLGRGASLDLFEAATVGDVERVRVLVEGGADLEGETSQGFTPLGLAAFFGHGDVVQLLLDKGASIDARDRSTNANTALDAAVAGNHTAVAMLLLSRGACPDVTDSRGFTPLHKAAHHGNKTLVEALLSHGASRDAVTDDGKRPADFAVGHSEVLELLR